MDSIDGRSKMVAESEAGAGEFLSGTSEGWACLLCAVQAQVQVQVRIAAQPYSPCLSVDERNVE